MGGLLGGLYATGHSVDDMERIVRTADWDDLLRSTPRFEDLSVSEKQEWNRITGVYSIPLRTGLALPGGINTGQALVRVLSGETAAYWDVDDFDNLPIPFRCVATDLMSGEAVVLGEGRLPEALRATMAIPGIFTPVEWNGRFLVDGGLVNNLPADVAKNMGADTVIAITLRLPDPKHAGPPILTKCRPPDDEHCSRSKRTPKFADRRYRNLRTPPWPRRLDGLQRR